MLAHSQVNRPINCRRGKTVFSCYVPKDMYKDIKSIQLVKVLRCPYSCGYFFSSPHLQFNSLLDISAWTQHCNLKFPV